jgi:hypothetical protein
VIWARHVECNTGKMRYANVYKILVEKPEGRPNLIEVRNTPNIILDREIPTVSARLRNLAVISYKSFYLLSYRG